MRFSTIFEALAFSSVASAAYMNTCSGVHGLSGYQGNTFQISVSGISSSQIGSICGSVDSYIRGYASSLGVKVGNNNCGTGSSSMAFTIQMDKKAWNTQASIIVQSLGVKVDGWTGGVSCTCVDGC